MPTHAFNTSIGRCEIVFDGETVTGFRLPADTASTAGPDATPPEWVARCAARVAAHLQGQPQDFADLPYAWTRVTDFQRQVYAAALAVRSGQTSSYGALAAALGQPPGASRAVGTALAQNPWPLLVPCHRLVGSDGRMVGFSGPGGISMKLRLLAIEGAQLFAEELGA